MPKGKRVWWVRLSRPLVTVTIIGFGVLGMFLSLPFFHPVIAVSGVRIGIILRIILEILDFVHLGL